MILDSQIVGQLFLILMSSVCVLYFTRQLSKLWIADKYTKEAQRLQLKINQAKHILNDLPTETSELSQDFSEMLPALLSELGIDDKALENPLVKGFLSKYLQSKGGSKNQQVPLYKGESIHFEG